jgi:NADH dehydrogenase
VTRIVVLGGGFAGLEAIRCLERRLRHQPDVELLLVSDRNYLLFTPLLPQVASSLVEPRHIIQPIRDIRGARRFRFRRDRVTGIDLASRRVLLAEGAVTYDRLVIALGGVTPTFGVPGVDEWALGYKWLDDAVGLRDHLIDLVEHADHEPDPGRRRQMLTVAVVGGGYTGVELVAELQDFFHSYVVRRYRGIGPTDYRLLLVEGGEQILRGVHPALATRARRKLHREGIEVMTETRVTRVGQGVVEINGRDEIRAALTVWAAGVRGNPVLEPLPVQRDPLGRLLVNGFLQLSGHEHVFGAGDAIAVAGDSGASIPIIPAALAHGRLAADNVLASLEGRPLREIEFEPRGMLVSLGEHDAVVDIGGVRVSGYYAWLFWNALHLWKLVGFRKQLQVAFDWGLAQHFPRDSAIIRSPARCPICAHVREDVARRAA